MVIYIIIRKEVWKTKYQIVGWEGFGWERIFTPYLFILFSSV